MPLSKNIKDRIFAMFKITANDETAVRTIFSGPPEGIPVDPLPGRETRPFLISFLDSGSLQQAVDGSVTPVDYTITPPVDEVWIVNSVSIWIEDKGVWELAQFAAGPVLTNGWVLQYLENGTIVHDIANVQNNFNLVSGYNTETIAGAGFISKDNSFIARLKAFENRGLVLDGTAGDILRFRVRDDLTFLNNLAAAITVSKVV